MSKYTTTVRNIIDTICYDTKMNNLTINEKIEIARVKIFNFDYPIFDKEYVKILETKILRRFYMREIAHETVDMWLFRLETKLNEIMPYYNELYKTTLLHYDPLTNYNIQDEYKKTGLLKQTGSNDNETTIAVKGSNDNETVLSQNNSNDSETIVAQTGSNENETISNNTNLEKMYDTPDNALIIENNNVSAGKSSTQNNNTTSKDNTKNDTTTTSKDINKIDSTTTSKDNTKNDTSSISKDVNKNDSTTTEDYIHTFKGYNGTSGASLITDFRNAIINIDEMILDKLNPLFFGLY